MKAQQQTQQKERETVAYLSKDSAKAKRQKRFIQKQSRGK